MHMKKHDRIEVMKRPLVIARLILMLLCATAGVRADEWPGPIVREVFSESRDWFVRVVPGTSVGNTFGFAGGAKNVRQGQQALYIALDDKGTELIFETETGAWQFCEWRANKQHLCRTTNGNRKWTGYVEPKLKP
jgi:hypothetical protein